MLLVFQIAIIWCWKNLYEVGTLCEVKGDATNAELGSMTSDELWTLNNYSLAFITSYILLSILIAFQNAKSVLI